MRAYPAVTTFRTCAKQVTIAGVTFHPGDKIAMPTSLAGRDPEAYADADTVILDRKSRYMSFGYGPHLCVGMHLAPARRGKYEPLEKSPPHSSNTKGFRDLRW